MIKILIKIFVKPEYDEDKKRSIYGYICGFSGIFFNVLLFAAKLIAGSLSSSIAITADAFNNLSDAGSSLISLLGFKLSSQKPDPDHPFGHGRYEYLSALAVSVLIIIMGFELLTSSVEKIIRPEAVEFSYIVPAILIFSVVLKLYMLLFNRSVGKRINSASLKAAALDSLSDSVATSVVIISLFITKNTGVNIDGWCGVAVALFILRAGALSAKDTVSPLLGQPPSAELVSQIESIVNSHDGIIGIHDLIVHDYGPGRMMISLHAEVPSDGNILELHDTIDNAEKELRNTLGCTAVLHMDPVCCDDEVLNDYKKNVSELVTQIDGRITIHDFRLVTGPTHINAIFDAVIPYDIKKSEEDIKSEISSLVFAKYPNLFCVIDIDRSYVI